MGEVQFREREIGYHYDPDDFSLIPKRLNLLWSYRRSAPRSPNLQYLAKPVRTQTSTRDILNQMQFAPFQIPAGSVPAREVSLEDNRPMPWIERTKLYWTEWKR